MRRILTVTEILDGDQIPHEDPVQEITSQKEASIKLGPNARGA